MTYAQALVLATPLYVMFALGTLPAGWLAASASIVLVAAFFLPGTRSRI